MGETDEGNGSRAPGRIPAPRSPRHQRRPDDELARLRRGDQVAFAELVRRLHPTMVRVAGGYVSSRAVAEEVAQDTWVAVIEQLDRFEGRSSLKTWIFRILTNKAKTRGVRERRTTPFSSLVTQREADEPAFPPDTFLDERHRWSGHWAQPVPAWELPEDHLLSDELGHVIQHAVDALPSAQRVVVALRDGQDLSAGEVCDMLDLSEANQRVLLHRGRAKVRAAVSEYVERLGVKV
jgi:RNA polymerase sigma-70 factor (ECF subfamily)